MRADIDILSIDIRSLTPGERAALTQHFMRRAHAERDQMIRAIGARLFGLLRVYLWPNRPPRHPKRRSAAPNGMRATLPPVLFYSLRS